MATHARLIGPYEEHKHLIIPFLKSSVVCGSSPPAPGPSELMMEDPLDISDFVDHPKASFFWKTYGDSMIGAGIFSGDILLLDRFYIPFLVPGDVIVAAEAGRDPMVKRLVFENKKPLLLPENPKFKPVPIDPEEGIEVMGVVLWNFHMHRGSVAVRRKLKAV